MGSCLHCTQSLQCQVSDTTDHHKILLVKHVVAFKKVDDSIVGEEHTWLAGVVGELLTRGRGGGGGARSSIWCYYIVDITAASSYKTASYNQQNSQKGHGIYTAVY